MTMFTPKTAIQDLAASLDQYHTTALDLVHTVFARIDDQHGEGERVFVRTKPDYAQHAAIASDHLRQAGLKRSILEGVPISIKDLFDMKGDVTRSGSLSFHANLPEKATATAIRRLEEAGAVIVGRTNMTEFAYSGLGINPHFGTPKHPFERDVDGGRIPGGSSSGAAISVTDGMSVVGIGTDTGGSVRIPAALCGLVGFKPSAARISLQGVMPLSSSLDSIGSIAPTVHCCGIVDHVMAGGGSEACLWQKLTAQPLNNKCFIVPSNVVLDHLDQHVVRAFENSLKRMRAAGARIVEVKWGELEELADLNQAGGLPAPEIFAYQQKHFEQYGHLVDPRVYARILQGKTTLACDYLALLKARQDWILRMTTKLSAYDGWLMPTVPIVAPKIKPLLLDEAHYFKMNGLMLRNPSMVNFLNGCALSIPCHELGELPVGLTLAGCYGQDSSILQLGLSIEMLLQA